jgi:AAA domain
MADVWDDFIRRAAEEQEVDEAAARDRQSSGNGYAHDRAAAPHILDAGEDDAPIPPRGWLLGTTFCRGFISGLTAQGASAKTTLRIVQALALATGRELTGEHVFQRCRVMIVTLEDSIDELRRRVRAARLHHGIAAEDVRGWLFLWAPAGMKIAEHKEGSRAVHAGELERRLRLEIAERRIDLVMIDPLVKAHGVEENDNGAIDAVAIILARLAADLNCAVDTLHHAPKAGANGPGDANRGRGASSFRDAARLLYTVTGMTEEEREQFGITEAERRSLIRLDSAKVNIAPPSIEARWFRIVGVPLGNNTDIYPSGDEVPTVEVWQPPDLWREISTFAANEILDQIECGPGEGRRYSAAAQAGDDRTAWRVVQAKVPSFSDQQCKTVIATWIKSGILEKGEYQDPILRKPRAGLSVGRRPG